MSKMRIENWSYGSQGSSVVAEFSIYYDNIKRADHFVKIIKSKKGNLFVSLPTRKITDEYGQEKYAPIVEIYEDVKRDFSKAVLELAEPLLRGISQATT